MQKGDRVIVNTPGINGILNEYFRITAPLFPYEPCEQICEAQRQILRLLCEVQSSTDLLAACLREFEETDCIKTCADADLLLLSDNARLHVALSLKQEALQAARIRKTKPFDAEIFWEELETNALAGRTDACKLLACCRWLGLFGAQAPAVAERICSMLAISGDRPALDMLIHILTLSGNTVQATRWSHIRHILTAEHEMFSVIALCTRYPDYTEEEVHMANIILYLSQAKAPEPDARLNGPMLCYILDSRDDYLSKLDRISARSNFYALMHAEDRFPHKKIGF